MRHGQAHPELANQGDYARSLTERGRRDAEAMGRLLAPRGWLPDRIVASPAERTAATARIVAAACGFDAARIDWQPDLYLAGPERYWRIVTDCEAARRCVLICGHNPGLSRLASTLGTSPRRRELPPAGLVTGVWDCASWQRVEAAAAEDCELAVPEDQPWQ